MRSIIFDAQRCHFDRLHLRNRRKNKISSQLIYIDKDACVYVLARYVDRIFFGRKYEGLLMFFKYSNIRSRVSNEHGIVSFKKDTLVKIFGNAEQQQTFLNRSYSLLSKLNDLRSQEICSNCSVKTYVEQQQTYLNRSLHYKFLFFSK